VGDGKYECTAGTIEVNTYRRVCDLDKLGYTTTQIATELKIQKSTVSYHKSRAVAAGDLPLPSRKKMREQD
jgi:orotate phosphoribosyltransferase-like protein